MIRAVLDANALVSGIVGRHSTTSTPGELFRRWLAGTYTLFVSQHVLDEANRPFQKPYFAERVARVDIDEGPKLIKSLALHTFITVAVSGVATHPENDLVLATAVSASADFLVTGDRQLFNLGAYGGVRILSPRDFLHLLDGQAAATTPAPPQ